MTSAGRQCVSAYTVPVAISSASSAVQLGGGGGAAASASAGAQSVGAHFTFPLASGPSAGPECQQCSSGASGIIKWCRYLHISDAPIAELGPYASLHAGSTIGRDVMYASHSLLVLNWSVPASAVQCVTITSHMRRTVMLTSVAAESMKASADVCGKARRSARRITEHG